MYTFERAFLLRECLTTLSLYIYIINYKIYNYRYLPKYDINIIFRKVSILP